MAPVHNHSTLAPNRPTKEIKKYVFLSILSILAPFQICALELADNGECIWSDAPSVRLDVRHELIDEAPITCSSIWSSPVMHVLRIRRTWKCSFSWKDVVLVSDSVI
jgi:hypothetical protein